RHFAALGAGVVVALTLLGSHPQLTIIALAPAGLYALGLIVTTRDWWRTATLAFAVAMGLGVSAVRFLPTIPLLQASERSSGLSLEASAIGSVTPHALLAGWFLPSVSIPRYLNAQWSAYLGPLPVLLALACRWTSRHVWLGLLAGTGIVLALGSYTPVYWLVQRTPLLTYFREPSRFLLWTVFACALLSAAGLDRLLAQSEEKAPVETKDEGPFAPPEARLRTNGSLRLSSFVLRLRRPWPLFVALSVVLALALTAAALQLLESTAISWLQVNALKQYSRGDYPPEHYVSLAYRSWRQVVRSVDLTYPGLFVPVAALAATAWWWVAGRWGRNAGWAALACVALPLLAYGQVRLPAIPASVVREQPAIGRMLGDSGTTAPGEVDVKPRVISWLPLAADFENRVRLEALGKDADVPSYRLLKQMVAPNLGMNAAIPLVDGYENLMTREQAFLAGALGSERATGGSELSISHGTLNNRRREISARWGLIAATGTGALITANRLSPPTWPVWVRYEPQVIPLGNDLPRLDVFLLSRPVPRAFVAAGWTEAGSAEEALAALVDEMALDESTSAVVTRPASNAGDPNNLAGRAAPRQTRPGAYQAEIVHYAERRVDVAVEADAEALLVLLDANAPGWTATVTGQQVPILNANVAFRGVLVPAGRHLVRFEYTPPMWPAALALTFICTAALALSAAAIWLSRSVLAARPGARFNI
ncbi:MAG TPA: YfhO family protein, partial [Chloroflexota bacterium]|nr:YfhO family protein [Chloroflexota bacterium]